MSTIAYYYVDEVSEKQGRGKYHMKQKGKFETKM